MPIKFSIYPSRRLILTEARGQPEGAELFEYYAALRSHPDFHPKFNEIVDLTHAEAINVSNADLKKFSESTARYTSLGAPVKVAIVAPGDLEFALSRMYELMQHSGNEIEVFRDRAAAEAWIGIDCD